MKFDRVYPNYPPSPHQHFVSRSPTVASSDTIPKTDDINVHTHGIILPKTTNNELILI